MTLVEMFLREFPKVKIKTIGNDELKKLLDEFMPVNTTLGFMAKTKRKIMRKILEEEIQQIRHDKTKIVSPTDS